MTLDRETGSAGDPSPAASAFDPRHFDRYLSVAPEAESFLAGLTTPRPVTVWSLDRRIDPGIVEATLTEAHGSRENPVARLGWRSMAWRLPDGARPGFGWLYRSGAIHVQEEASLLPVLLLDPRPGERVLDLCAAPGGKTAQISEALGGRGTVIANERNAYRTNALRDTVKRLGLLNVTTTVSDGRRLPTTIGTFDAVLVDAPCSSEGTRHGSGASYARTSSAFRDRLERVQLGLLFAAADLCRPGGRVVYSTCSFAPEENEAIVDRLLETREDIEVEPFEVPGLTTDPGLVCFESRRLRSELRGAIRLWPHRSGTGGFFAVRLRRTGGAPRVEPASIAEVERVPGLDRALEAVSAHFGWPASVFGGLRFFVRRRQLHALADDHVALGPPVPSTGGLPLGKVVPGHLQLSTSGILQFGRHATRHVLELSADEVRAYHQREEWSIPAARIALDQPDSTSRGRGAVIVRHDAVPLGRALLTRVNAEAYRVTSEYPVAWIPGGSGR
ncbi:MAG: RsmB/NOP family class I SAM-dependent RNA methyltransferase [Planctomycetes bacterium]|nr:RsmB/NOP family class I SAM-dependent RNA methyltransferase [Planctomycetota bacterium]